MPPEMLFLTGVNAAPVLMASGLLFPLLDRVMVNGVMVNGR